MKRPPQRRIKARRIWTITVETVHEAWALISVVAATRGEDSRAEVIACFEPSRMRSKPVWQHRNVKSHKIRPQLVVRKAWMDMQFKPTVLKALTEQPTERRIMMR
jgi:hypothetical protein